MRTVKRSTKAISRTARSYLKPFMRTASRSSNPIGGHGMHNNARRPDCVCMTGRKNVPLLVPLQIAQKRAFDRFTCQKVHTECIRKKQRIEDGTFNPLFHMEPLARIELATYSLLVLLFRISTPSSPHSSSLSMGVFFAQRDWMRFFCLGRIPEAGKKTLSAQKCLH